MSQTTNSFEDLAHALRVLGEVFMRAHVQGLLKLDRDEAVGNIENALASVLNAFHSLHDAVDKEAEQKAIDWYATPQLATILILRNARHHNIANKVRTIYAYYTQESRAVDGVEQYITVNFLPGEAEGFSMPIYLSWADMNVLLSLPQKESRVRPQVAASVQKYLNVTSFSKCAGTFGLQESRIFFNVIPLIVNAMIELAPKLKDLVIPRSAEGKAFIELFQHMPPTKMSKPDVKSILMHLPQ